ncbi:MAG: class A beta-lactamase-related serine hydrolase [Gloeomargarita sp. SKYG116]|nr:class A beta-lactamase-related serine hydrolase [Gloeomargarita sp. SKYG116]MCS7225372.1 class A beta-lactamase-related serine hydrolase [Gloeomargarita sp. SKYB31]MDW8400603.1 serine hydrolase [Gloeomargarita sp. SKYGB_i_bin116]
MTKNYRQTDLQTRWPLKKRAQPWWQVFLLSALRLGLLGVGLGVLTGTGLHIWLSQGHDRLGPFPLRPQDRPPTWQSFFWPPAPDQPALMPQPVRATTLEELIPRRGEMTPLQQQLLSLIQRQPQMQVSIYAVDLDSGEYLDINGTRAVSAASTIKLPLLLALFQAWDQGKVRLDERLTMTKALVAGGSGNMQFQPVGTTFSLLDTATRMIVISDNTATNMILARLGGKEVVNRQFEEWGLQTTVIRNLLPDLKGTNTTSAADLVHTLAIIERGEFLSRRSRDWLLHILRSTENRSLLPAGLGPGAVIGHKTGDIGFIIGDAGVVDTATGQRYLIAIFVQSAYNDPRAVQLLQELSRQTYRYLNRVKSPDTPSPSDRPPPARTN